MRTVFRLRCRLFAALAIVTFVSSAFAMFAPVHARAGSMDLALDHLGIPGGHGGCTATNAYCADNEAFERLVSEFAVAVTAPVSSGAATLGPAGFYLGVSSTLTPISASGNAWQRGSQGGNSAVHNTSPDAALVWNRFSVRKGLPFGFELGTSLGQGIDTSIWVLAAELKWALLEGYHSGLGHFPDLALHGTLSTTVGAGALSLQTDTLDVILSKPYVVFGSYRMTPFLALQGLFVRARTGRVDLTPGTSGWDNCKPAAATGSATGAVTSCSGNGSDLANDVVFNPVSQTRWRMFAGLEVAHQLLISSLSVGYDLAVPSLATNNPEDGISGPLARQIAFQLSLGLRY